MQYLWKITVLGVSEQVNRLVALEGDLPLDSVLNLCNLAFDYDNYPEKALYFATSPAQAKSQGQTQAKAQGQAQAPALAAIGRVAGQSVCGELSGGVLSLGRTLLDELIQLPDDRYGATAKEFWKDSVEAKVAQAVDSGGMVKLDLQAQPALKLEFATRVLEENLTSYASEMQQVLDAQPNSLNLTPRFLYELHGVWHLVEVMKCSTKLMCFIPSCIAGTVTLTDDEQKLSVAEIERQFKAQAEQEEKSGEGIGLDLRACTARMRALQTDLGNEKVNDVMLQAGATPIKFK